MDKPIGNLPKSESLRRLQSRLELQRGIALMLAGIYLLWAMFQRAESPHRILIASIGSVVAPLIGVVFAVQSFGKRHRSTAGTKPLLHVLPFAGYLLLFAGGMATYAVYELILHKETPLPSWADALWLTGYLFLLIGIALLPSRAIAPALRGRVFFDGMMIMVGAVTFSWYFVLGPTLQQSAESPLAKWVMCAYPMFDLIVLFCILVFAAYPHEGRLQSARRLLVSGMLLFTFSDVGYGWLSLRDRYYSGHPVDVGWLLGTMLIGLGVFALRVHSAHSVEKSESHVLSVAQKHPILWRSLLPYLFVPAVGGLLLYTIQTPGSLRLKIGVYLGSACLLTLILFRQVLALMENNRLFRLLQEAYSEAEINNRALEDANSELEEANAQLEALATTDGMTGLPNHRHFQERLRAELARGQRERSPLALLLLDVDHFKQYNDSFGHPAGDEALQIVASVLRTNLRTSDLPARYGGEEFAIILPDTNETVAAEIAERLRAAVVGADFPHRAVTVSIGVMVSGTTWEPERLIAAADAALYAAKVAGRNRVQFHTMPLEKAA